MKRTLALCLLVVALAIGERLSESYHVADTVVKSVTPVEVQHSRSNPIKILRTRFDLAALPDDLH